MISQLQKNMIDLLLYKLDDADTKPQSNCSTQVSEVDREVDGRIVRQVKDNSLVNCHPQSRQRRSRLFLEYLSPDDFSRQTCGEKDI